MGDITQICSAQTRVIRLLIVLAIAAALCFGIPPVIAALGAHVWAKQAFGQYGYYLLYIASGFVLIFVAVMAMWRAGLGSALEDLGITHLSGSGCLVCLAAIGAAFVVIFYAGARWTPQPTESLLIFGVVGPFVEEVLFRGFLFRQARRWAAQPFWIAATVSSLLFGAAHFDQADTLTGSLMNGAITFGGGFLFCWLVERWNSIWPGFVIHAGLNLLWSVFTLGNNAVGGEMGNIARLATIVVAIAATFAFSRRPCRDEASLLSL